MTAISSAEQPLIEPGHGQGLLDVLRNRFLLRLLVKKELRVRYRASVLGMAWSYVKPLVQFLVFYLALGVFLGMQKSIPNYAVYLFSGIIVMNFFGEGYANATRSIMWNAPLINKIYLPRELFPVASLWVSAVHFFPQLVVLLVASFATGWRPTGAELAAGVLGFAIVALLALGLGLMFGAFNVYFRDAENFVDMIVMVLTWMSPVMYTWGQVQEAVPALLFRIYELNPLTASVELFHYAFWWGSGTNPRPEYYPGVNPPRQVVLSHLWEVGILGLLIAVLIVLLGQFVFRRLEGRFAQEL